MVTIHNFGLNNIDLEGKVEQNETSERIRTVERQVSGLFRDRTAFELPPNIGFKVLSEKGEYYGLLDTEAIGKPQKLFRNPDDGVTILADEKYDLVGGLTPRKPDGINDFWQVRVTDTVGGGGAYNTAFGQHVYLTGLGNKDIQVRLIVPVGHTAIRREIPAGLEYAPLLGDRDDEVPVNLNFAPVNGKKITLRSRARTYSYERGSNLGIHPGDIVVLNTVRDPAYLKLLEDVLQKDEHVRLFLATTDSMIQALDVSKVLDLGGRSELYVSNREELEKLTGTQVSSESVLIQMMQGVQTSLRSRDGMIGRAYVTFGEYGSAVHDRDRTNYYQSTAPLVISPITRRPVTNTNGCGDQYLSIAVIGEVLGLSALEILNYANAAGHMCATQPTASGPWMATERTIRDFRDTYGRPGFHRYNPGTRAYVRMSM